MNAFILRFQEKPLHLLPIVTGGTTAKTGVERESSDDNVPYFSNHRILRTASHVAAGTSTITRVENEHSDSDNTFELTKVIPLSNRLVSAGTQSHTFTNGEAADRDPTHNSLSLFRKCS